MDWFMRDINFVNNKMKTKSQSQLKKTAWKLMSEYTRRKVCDWREIGRCITCGTSIHWKEANAGHFIHRDCLDFDFRNINFQCVRCNKYLGGNLVNYTLWMLDKYGKKTVEELKKISNQPRYFTVRELKEIIEDLKQKLLELK